MDESSTSWYETSIFHWFPVPPAYSHLGTVYSAWIFAKHIKLWNQKSLHYGALSQGGVDYTVSPFPEHNYWSYGMEF